MKFIRNKSTHFSDSLDIGYGGPATSVPVLAEKLRDPNTVLFSLDKESACNELIGHEWVKLGSYNRISQIVKMSRLIDESSVLYLHTLWSPWLILVLFMCIFRPGISLVVFVRGSLNINSLKKHIFNFLILSNIFKLSKKIITATNNQKISEVKPFLHDKVLILPNLVPVPLKVKNTLTNEAFCEKTFLFCGRIHRHKRIEIILKLLHKLKFNNLTIAGRCDDPIYFEELKKLSLDLNIEIIYSGVVNKAELSKLYINSDFLILCSLSENFGNVVIEAALHGTLPLVSRNLYICEYLPNQICFDEKQLDLGISLDYLKDSEKNRLLLQITTKVFENSDAALDQLRNHHQQIRL